MSYSIMLDAIHDDTGNIPAATAKVAGYVTGTPGIQWTSSDWARFPEAGHVRIDQSPELVSWVSGAADVADMENGAAVQGEVIAGALARKAKGWLSFVYVAEGNLAELQAAVNSAGLNGHVQYWVANWNLSEAEAAAALAGDVAAVQYASPSSNPSTVVPGGSQVLSAANLDISVTVPGWFAYAAPKRSGMVVTGNLQAYPVTSPDGITWTRE